MCGRGRRIGVDKAEQVVDLELVVELVVGGVQFVGGFGVLIQPTDVVLVVGIFAREEG